MSLKFDKRFIFGSVTGAMLLSGWLVFRRYREELSRAYRRIAADGKLVDTACGPVQYSEFGQGAPILIVHGAGGGYDQGEYFARLLGGDYRWIAPSRFGFLGASVPAGADSALQADAYACLLNALGIDRVGVVGVSMGGPSALLFARRHPQRTNSLVMISAASHAIPPRPALLAAIFNLFLKDFVFWSMVRLIPAGLLAALGVPMDVQKHLSPAETVKLRSFLASIIPMSARRSGQLLEQRMSEIDPRQIREIEAPTLVVHARDDTLVSFEQGQFTAGNIRGAQLVPLEKGGHLALMLDRNSGARQKTLAFLERYNHR